MNIVAQGVCAMNQIRLFLRSYHPIVHSLILGTVLARTASTMSLPFLAIYLYKHTNMDAWLIGLVIGAGALAGTVGGFVGGALSDRYGRRVIMLSALFGWVVVFCGFAVAKLPLVFLLLSMINGLCRSFYEPVSQALMADLTEPDKRFKVFSLRYMAINIGAAVGPLLGAYVATLNGSLPFFITGLVYLIYAIVLYALLLKFGIKKIEGVSKGDITLRSAWNVVRRDAAFRLFILGGVMSGIGYSQITVSLSQYLQDNFAGGVSLFAVLMSVNAIVVVALQIPLGRWAGKRTPLTSLIAGTAMFALGDVGFAFSYEWIGFIAAMTVFTLGEILNYPAANLMIDRLAPDGMRGTYYGAQAFGNLGHFLGPWIGGLLLASYGGSVLFGIMAALALSVNYFYTSGERIRLRTAVVGDQTLQAKG
jgi:MFS family permease